MYFLMSGDLFLSFFFQYWEYVYLKAKKKK